MKPGDDDFPLGGHGTLRDYFAAAALQGITSIDAGEILTPDMSKLAYIYTAKACYSFADAMIAERMKP